MLLSNLFGLATFQAVELTAQIQRIAYMPTMLEAYGESLFVTSRSSSPIIALAQMDDMLSLIPTSPRGAPPVELEKKPGDIRMFRTHRLAKGSTLYVDSLTAALAGPDYQLVHAVQTEFADRAARIRRDIAFTQEYMRFGAIQGRVVDADGSILDDFWQSWGVGMPPWIELPLNDPTANLSDFRSAIRDLLRTAERTSKGGWIPGRTRFHAFCGKDFYDKLVTHPAIAQTYLYHAGANELRGMIMDQFELGGVVWIDFHGDEAGILAIADDEAHLFPVGGNEVFRTIYGPAEFEPWINQPGMEIYAIMIPDRDRGAWMRWEGYTYPLHICVRPEMLRRMRIKP